MNIKNKGFTLIELLVAIVIIGILAGVVMMNLTGESDKAKDARVKSGMGQLRTLMESARASNATLSYVSPASVPGSTDIIADIKKNNGNKDIVSAFNSTAWCAHSVLIISANGPWCVDSSGFAGKGSCNSTNIKCQ